MIYSVGTGLCDVRRIAVALARRGERFAGKVLGPAERVLFQARRGHGEGRGLRFLATRLSGKQAFSRASGLGLRPPMAWHDCEILNERSGQPVIRLHGALAAWLATRHLTAHVTLTDEAEYVAAFVVLERAA